MVKRIFKWAVAEELAPPAVYQALAAVTGLQRGRSAARETEPIGPVDDVVIDATLPHLNRHVRGLIQFQRLTGCRPGEACELRRSDIDLGGSVWLYRPPKHKNAHRGHSRTIAIGPQGQAILKEFFTPDIDEYMFNPARAVAEVRAERAARRRTPRYTSHMKRNATIRKADPQRVPATKYCVSAYEHALARACDRAFPPPEPLSQREGETHAQWWRRLTDEQRAQVKAWRKAHRWHPNQLRHSFATKVRKLHGLEAAQVLLGHSRADVTQLYAERNEQLASAIAAQVG
jgi:integrase